MARTARKKSETGIYHVILRGINKQLVFEEDSDYERFLTVLGEVKEISRFKLYAFCLMPNHIHLLMEEKEEPLGEIFRRIGSRFVFWYNWKYERSGHLFQGRYTSEPVESDEYFIAVLAYIHQNPVKAGLCSRASDYRWSSRSVLGSGGIVDTDELANIISLKDIAYLDERAVDDDVLEIKIGRKQLVSDYRALEWLKDYFGVVHAAELQALDRDLLVQAFLLLQEKGVSIRQFSRLSGLSKGVLERMKRSSS